MFSKCAGKRTKEDIVIFTFYLCNTYCGKLKKNSFTLHYKND